MQVIFSMLSATALIKSPFIDGYGIVYFLLLWLFLL